MTLPSLSKLKSVRLPRYGTEIRPVRDWLALLGGAALLLIASALWNAFFFVGILTDAAPPENSTPSGPDRSSVERAASAFEAREVERVRYEAEYRFVDPSR